VCLSLRARGLHPDQNPQRELVPDGPLNWLEPTTWYGEHAEQRCDKAMLPEQSQRSAENIPRPRVNCGGALHFRGLRVLPPRCPLGEELRDSRAHW
jgi:hypothetical protein